MESSKMTFQDKLSDFCDMVQGDTLNRYLRQLPNLDAPMVLADKPGQKFVRVYFQDMWDGKPSQKSSRYFVRVSDGAIFACEGWKTPNLNRQFGTLDTVEQFDWSGYEGVAEPDSIYVMKPVAGGSGYQTAVLK